MSNEHPPLPPGADPERVDDWATDEGVTSRLIWSLPVPLPRPFNGDNEVRTVVTQVNDGTMYHDCESVFVGGIGYTLTDAEELAEAINTAADLVNRWTEPETLDMSTNEHACSFNWCRSPREAVDYEHWGSGEVLIGNHSPHIGRITAYAFVTAEPSGKVYDDEIVLNVYGDDESELALMSLTDDEARQIRDLLDLAIIHRAEVRGGEQQ